LTTPSPIQKIDSPLLSHHQVRLYLKRDDQVHPTIIGNKWRKLKYNLQRAKELNHNTLLTFGGAFSNHIHAVAAAGKSFDFQTIGIIRGERITPFNPTLQFAEAQGMQLEFVDRTTYREKNSLPYLHSLKEKYGTVYIIPEGGTNKLALQGCVEIVEEIEQQSPNSPDYLCTSCGTGGTIAGIIQGAKKSTHVLGFSSLKGNFLTKEIERLLTKNSISPLASWSINTTYHFGGYAKFDNTLIDFINQFKQQHQIQLDPIYTGKMMYGVFDLIEKGYFPKGSSIVAIHTGGLQGIAGFNQRLLINLMQDIPH